MEVDVVGSSNRRNVVAGLGALAAVGGIQANRAQGQSVTSAPDLILFNGKITTLDRQNPEAEALAIRAGRFMQAERAQDIMRFAGHTTPQTDLKGGVSFPASST